jgi:NAD(P)-dependent dehydrogenase (short-subunit alcohol dehydrogenase family)
MKYLDTFKLAGKVAFITGGSRGLGLEIAEALREAGAKVALMARREAYFAEALVSIPDALCIIGDVSSEDDVKRAVAECEAKLGVVDILVNAAGISWGAPAVDMPAEKFRQVMQVNVDGSFYAAKAVAPGMIRKGYGKIINIASIAGIKGEPSDVLDAVGYSSSKAAVIGMTRDLANKWGPLGIRVNAIAPGFFPTKMTEKVIPKITERLQLHNPLRRAGKPGEIGGAGLFLASAASDYVNGHTLVVDGGSVA